jgi:hypothetical protein
LIRTHGVWVRIDWSKFIVGTSVFVPGVDQHDLKLQLRGEARGLGYSVSLRAVAEKGVMGVRMWRLP